MSAIDDLDDEPTQRTLAPYLPAPGEMPQAIARIRWEQARDRRERRALQRWAAGVIVSVIGASLTVAIVVGRYIERVDAAQRSIERVEALLLEGRR